MGRPSLYKGLNKRHLERLCKAGWTDAQIAEFFDIDLKTLYRWKNKYPAFSEKMKDWKEYADAKVERSLYETACGFKCVETVVKTINGRIVKVPIIKQYAPNPIAITMWLTNRKHKDWKKTREEQGSDPLTVKIMNLIKQDKDTKKSKAGDNGKPSDTKVAQTISVNRPGGLKIVD